MNIKTLIKTLSLFLFMFGVNNYVNSQEITNPKKYRQITADELEVLQRKKSMHKNNGIEKTTVCRDTLRYTYQKEAMMGDLEQSVGGFGLAQDTNKSVIINTVTGDTLSWWYQADERLSHAFINTGELTITGVEFPSANDPIHGSPQGVTVRASIYTVDESFKPMASLGSGTVFITQSFKYAYYVVNFEEPIVVSGNYAIVLDIPNHGEGCWIMGSDGFSLGQPWFESYCYVYDYINTKDWTTIPNYYLGDEWELYIAPIVEYSLTASANYTPVKLENGDEVTLTSTTNEAFLSNRMFNAQEFLRYWEFLPVEEVKAEDGSDSIKAKVDSTYIWNLNDNDTVPTIITEKTAKLIYDGSDDQQPTLTINGGFSAGCSDDITIPIIYVVDTIDVNTSIYDHEILNLSLFPNPTRDIIHIDGLESDNAVVEVSDIHGKILIKTDVNSPDFSLSAEKLINGVYFISIFTDNGKFHQKIIKQ